MTLKEKARFIKYIKENYTKVSLKHLLVDLEVEKKFWETDLKAYLIASNEYNHMKLLIDKIAELFFQIEKVKQEIENL
jgi:hypothetical protein